MVFQIGYQGLEKVSHKIIQYMQKNHSAVIGSAVLGSGFFSDGCSFILHYVDSNCTLRPCGD